jgi:hypothetical protein
MNNCTGRGACVYGFCHCQRGWWGLDCSRSKAHGPRPGLLPRRDAPRIYVYELPTWLSHRHQFDFFEIYR